MNGATASAAGDPSVSEVVTRADIGDLPGGTDAEQLADLPGDHRGRERTEGHRDRGRHSPAPAQPPGRRAREQAHDGEDQDEDRVVGHQQLVRGGSHRLGTVPVIRKTAGAPAPTTPGRPHAGEREDEDEPQRGADIRLDLRPAAPAGRRPAGWDRTVAVGEPHLSSEQRFRPRLADAPLLRDAVPVLRGAPHWSDRAAP